MFKLNLITLVVAMTALNGHTCDKERKIVLSRSDSRSECSNPIFIDQPKQLCDCASKSKFRDQVSHNYNIMYDKLTHMGCDCKESDLSEFKKILKEMKNKILDIIDAYYECSHGDPTKAISDAIDSYDSIRKRFRAYSRRAFNKCSTKCNDVIQYIRRLPYISAENTIMSMLTCAKLKSH